MISRNLYYQIIIRVFLITGIAFAAGFAVAFDHFTVAIFCILFEIPAVAELVKYLNTINRKINYFLESIQNQDSTLHFPTNVADKPIRALYESLNKVNEQIQQLKIENQQREQYFQTLLEHVATGIVTYNLKGFILHANSAAKKLLAVEVLTHINQLERINRSLFQAVKLIKPFEQKLVSMSTERGTIELSLKATPFKTPTDELILLSIQDIRNELDEKELDSWMKLIRVLMHEIMNSIAPITSLSESLSKYFTIGDRPVQPAEIDEKTIQSTIRGLNVIREQGNGMILFVESYRRLTRLPKPDKKVFRIRELMERIKVLFFSLENSRQINLKITVVPPEMDVYADENLISQVLLNLMKNALEALSNETEGRIHVSAHYSTNMHPEICVIDNGPGIPEEILEQIFVPFFTTRENGSGIGLSLSRQIMRLHGGSLQVRSVPNKETVFCISF
jgi:two-component system nitrogen regulation sensor histidine kinase NtrY